MRFSPYAMEDYGLQHKGGSISPFTMPSYDAAKWNLYWASIPELEVYLNIAYQDFDAFKKLNLTFPYERKVRADQMLANFPHLRDTFMTGTPQAALLSVNRHAFGLIEVLRDGASTWMDVVGARLRSAQTLAEMKEAAALCQSIIAVDFKARRRL